MASPFTYVELHSTDAARAKAFYSELFGWKTKDTTIPGFGTYTEIETEGVPGAGLMPQQEPGAKSAWLAYVLVPKLDDSVKRATNLGAKVVTPRTEIKKVGWFAIIEDPAGARLGIFEKLE